MDSNDKSASPTSAGFGHICPLLGSAEDITSPYDFPTRRNRCYADDLETNIAYTHQRHFCLQKNHSGCPVFDDPSLVRQLKLIDATPSDVYENAEMQNYDSTQISSHREFRHGVARRRTSVSRRQLILGIALLLVIGIGGFAAMSLFGGGSDNDSNSNQAGLIPISSRTPSSDRLATATSIVEERATRIAIIVANNTATALAELPEQFQTQIAPTNSPTIAITASNTPSPTQTATTTDVPPSATNTATATASVTPTATPTATASDTPSPTQTATATDVSPSATNTATATASVTPTATPTATASDTPSPTQTATTTDLPPSATNTATATRVEVAANQGDAVDTNTPVPTNTASPTMTITATQSATVTPLPTDTPSTTPTPSATQTAEPTSTSTFTASPTSTASLTATPTPSATLTHTLTNTPTPTATATASSTSSFTPSNTPTPTYTWTASVTFTATATPSITPTLTLVPPTVAVNTTTPTLRPQPASIDEINLVIENITNNYGITFAVLEEWQPASSEQLIELYSYLLNIETSFKQTAILLHYFSRTSADIEPQVLFRNTIGSLGITIDRTTQTLPPTGAQTLLVENNAIDARYILQLSPQGMSSGFPIVRELAFILNDALGSMPLLEFATATESSTVNGVYQPGLGYANNEVLFPNAFSSRSDFQDALARMLNGELSLSVSPERYEFFVERIPAWVTALLTTGE